MDHNNSTATAYQAIIDKAHEDANFKSALIANPEKALTDFGVEVEKASNLKLKVTDQSDPSKIYINIHPPFTDSVELSDEELEAIAGGCSVEIKSLELTAGYKSTLQPMAFPKYEYNVGAKLTLNFKQKKK